MPRTKNDHQSATITIRPSAEVGAYLDELAEIGIHGKTRAEVARTLVGYEVERLIREGVIKVHGSSERPSGAGA